MSDLFYELKKDQRSYRLVQRGCVNAKYKASVLTTLLGEIEGETKGTDKEITDELILAKIKKFIKNIDMFIGHAKTDVVVDRLNVEKLALTVYLPKQLTGAELTDIVNKYIRDYDYQGDSLNTGIVMRWLKSNYAGLYDGRVASTIVKERIEATQ